MGEKEVEQGKAGEEDVVQIGKGEGVGEGVILVHPPEYLGRQLMHRERHIAQLTSHCCTQDCAHAVKRGSPRAALAVMGLRR